jgi:L-threonylcarbamoyladenylate synthase
VDVPLLAGLRTDGSPDAHVAAQVARAWLAGGIVGLPTETVYGLAADAQDADAVARVYRAKGRPADHPLIVHVQGVQALAGWSAQPNPAAERLAGAFWPGALTVIVSRSERAGDFITGGQGTVALRCPDHPVARACLEALARLSGDPARGVAAPSANRFGRVSPTRALDVLAEVGSAMDPERDLVVDGGACAIGVESTIVDCTATPPRVLRLGAISQEQVDAVLSGAGAAGSASTGPAEVPGAPSSVEATTTGAGAGQVRAPGTLDSHYAPRAQVLLVEPGPVIGGELPALVGRAPGRPARTGSRTARIVGGERGSDTAVGLIAGAGVGTPEGWTRLSTPATADEYARDLYAALRRADELGLGVVVAVLPDATAGPLALAVRDRLARAAHREGP